MKRAIFVWVFVSMILSYSSVACAEDMIGVGRSGTIIHYFKKLKKSTQWQLVDEVKLNFCTYHTQGLVKVGDYFYLSAVEKIVQPKKFETPQDGYDRTPGEGVGYLFKFDLKGKLISKVTLGEGTVYHPGGIDYDGRYIWVPVAEYRPNSDSIIYRVDPKTLETVEVFRFKDHIGGIVHNTWDETLHGSSWGSRRMYTWKLNEQAGVVSFEGVPESTKKMNGSHYIDYQDCHYLADRYMLCCGLNKYTIPDFGQFAFGGLDLLDLDLQLAIHQIPVPLWVNPTKPMTNNPFYFETYEDHLRFYFIPEDDKSTLYVYDAFN